jgi:site-specific recombinase XerD
MRRLTLPVSAEPAMESRSRQSPGVAPERDFDQILAEYIRRLTDIDYRSAGTARTYSLWVIDYHRWLSQFHPGTGLGRATAEMLGEYLGAKRDQRCKPATLATGLHSLRSFYRFLQAVGGSDTNPAAVIRTPKVFAPTVDPYSEDEIRIALSYARQFEGSADRRRWVGLVTITLLAGTGIRNGELVGLRTANVDTGRQLLSVLGKGSKPRTVPFGPATAQVLSTYLSDLRPRLTASPYVLVNPLAPPTSPHRGRMQSAALIALVRTMMSEAGVPGRHHPHRFRHTFATNALREARDIEVVRELLGHADITTTGRYLHATMADKHSTVDRLDFAGTAAPAISTIARPMDVDGKYIGEGAAPSPKQMQESAASEVLVRQVEAAADAAVARTRTLPATTLAGLSANRLAEAVVAQNPDLPVRMDALVVAAALTLSRSSGLAVSAQALATSHQEEAVGALTLIAAALANIGRDA